LPERIDDFLGDAIGDAIGKKLILRVCAHVRAAVVLRKPDAISWRQTAMRKGPTEATKQQQIFW